MSHIFYDTFINWDKLTQSLSTLGVSGEERIELIEVIEESLHTEILVLILEQLPHTEHEIYIERFHAAPHDESHLHFIAIHSKEPIDVLIRNHSERFFDELIANFLSD